jgi:hypothetical protein
MAAPVHSHDHYEETIYGVDGMLTWTVVAWTADFAPRRAFASKITQDFPRRPHPLTDALSHPLTPVFVWPIPLRCEITAVEVEPGRSLAAHSRPRNPGISATKPNARLVGYRFVRSRS